MTSASYRPTAHAVFILRTKVKGAARRFKGGIRSAGLQVGANLIRTARMGMEREKKLGRMYTRKGRRKRASAPGQYPGIVTGETIRGLDMTMRGSEQLEFGIKDRVAKPKHLPTFLELGTRVNGKVRMEPRPTLQLANASQEKNSYNWFKIIPIKKILRK